MDTNKGMVDVSVIIPYFRSSDTINRAVDSVLSQTMLPREIIIIDDFSNTEEDLDILKKLDSIDLIKVIFNEVNRGAGETRNSGMKVAKSKYIAFLDSDDIWTREKLETQVRIMEQSHAYISGHHSSIYGSELRYNNKISKISIVNQIFKNRFYTRTVMMLNTKNYNFEKNKRYGEDYLLWTQILLDKHKGIYFDKTLAHSFKENYGESGLTGNVNNMYKGALNSYKTLYKSAKISIFTYGCLVLFQSFKQMMRLIRLIGRKRNIWS